jgi:hypothetical protein
MIKWAMRFARNTSSPPYSKLSPLPGIANDRHHARLLSRLLNVNAGSFESFNGPVSWQHEFPFVVPDTAGDAHTIIEIQHLTAITHPKVALLPG